MERFDKILLIHIFFQLKTSNESVTESKISAKTVINMRLSYLNFNSRCSNSWYSNSSFLIIERASWILRNIS